MMGRILAIDYGEKRVGIAVSDPLGMIANPLQTLAPAKLMSFLNQYIAREDVSTVIIGDPKTLINKPGPLSEAVSVLSNRIAKTNPRVQVHLVDERFTSKIAARTLVEAGYRKKQRQQKENLDKVSATILLQDYINSAK